MKLLLSSVLMAVAILMGSAVYVGAHSSYIDCYAHHHQASSASACNYGCHIVDHDDDHWNAYTKKCRCRD